MPGREHRHRLCKLLLTHVWVSGTPTRQIVALSHLQWNNGENCHKAITITFKSKSATARIVDQVLCLPAFLRILAYFKPQCMGCPYGGLDFSPGLFSYLTDGDLGLGIISGLSVTS